ncbi:Biosynthetic arginine decarboxylase [Halomicronema hongdechloris C2206]|uniref:Biosynthetic arginine decarboxylase n=1 Tax=Halomicronema hongdechloris C2206 TaxID=1641165 RepID=A0A1Z3HGQ5_9CYAN|nr:biosynthetic arginine decarboxylase [Halomicronema hongdechloris]ASC69377.1 Biosynthetic arginine decarboxylase [Halomicronema hongdechloris C2206]
MSRIPSSLYQPQPQSPSSDDTAQLLAPSASWTIEDSEELYRIQGWGDPYFSINAAGHITVSPQGERGGSLDLYELVQALQQRNLGLPILIRFSDILQDRLERLQACFAKAIARYRYGGVYRGVFPVKCNQQRHLVEDLVRFGSPHQFGLEAGSKPELLIALATLNTPGSLLICNGYKDREYIETAMLGQRLGQVPIIVLEQQEEVDLVIQASHHLDIQPVLGVRVKLSSQGIGRWGSSAGDRAKFGLTIPEVLTVVERLRQENMLDCLQLLHFHIGSQISAISVIKDALREASRIYVELAALGANMRYLDVGGGLGVDYDGSKTNFHASKNYSIQNYANDVVAEVKEACASRHLTPPTLISESGRAIASHQSVLVFDVLGSSDVPTGATLEPPGEDDHPLVRELYETYANIGLKNYQEVYHDALQFKEEAISLFSFGYLSLTERATLERLFWACCAKICTIIRHEDYVPDDLEDLEKIMASIYYINLSVFQSAPDAWAIGQLFPIMPIHRLDEEPSCRATLADLTCDSDGKNRPIYRSPGCQISTRVASLNSGEPYYLGLFLGEPTRRLWGNLPQPVRRHQLQSTSNLTPIRLSDRTCSQRGHHDRKVLGYVQYDSEDLVENIRRRTEQALQDRQITLHESQLLLQHYEHSAWVRYTYLARPRQ